MWKLWIRELARTWRELRAGVAESSSVNAVTEPRAEREAKAGWAVEQARRARLRLGMF
jgi:hypothetical protein